MTVIPLEELPARLEKGARLLGLDLGEKTIGLAVSDRSRTVASPIETLRRGKFTRDAEALAKLCEERGVGGLILGLALALMRLSPLRPVSVWRVLMTPAARAMASACFPSPDSDRAITAAHVV